jgi:hypothetical protein
MMIDEDEREQIKEAATWRAKMESRLSSLEDDRKKILYGLGAAALLILTSIWKQIELVLFK